MTSITMTARLYVCRAHSKDFVILDGDAKEGNFFTEAALVCDVDGCLSRDVYTVWLIPLVGEYKPCA